MSAHLREFMLSLEAETDGKKAAEVEHCFLGRVKDFEQLKKAERTEHQEQYEVRTKPDGENHGVNGLIRVRAIDKKTYVLTTKVYYKGRRGCTETEVETTKDMFEHFKKMAPVGHEKLRHYFPTDKEGQFWEVDVYVNDNGDYEDWVRMELEVTNLKDELPEFPLEVEEFINCDHTKISKEEKKKADKLYKETFVKHLEENFLPIAN